MGLFVNVIFKINFFVGKCLYCDSNKFVPKGPIDDKSALDCLMAWHQTGNKPPPEPKMIQHTEAHFTNDFCSQYNLLQI